jgi:hypothetical protein
MVRPEETAKGRGSRGVVAGTVRLGRMTKGLEKPGGGGRDDAAGWVGK